MAYIGRCDCNYTASHRKCPFSTLRGKSLTPYKTNCPLTEAKEYKDKWEKLSIIQRSLEGMIKELEKENKDLNYRIEKLWEESKLYGRCPVEITCENYNTYTCIQGCRNFSKLKIADNEDKENGN
jgi:hypothetical protein